MMNVIDFVDSEIHFCSETKTHNHEIQSEFY